MAKSRIVFWLLLLTSGGVPPLHAQEAVPPYNKSYIIAAHAVDESAAPAQLQSRDNLLKQQIQTIDSLLTERGPFGHGLDEAYRDFGKLHFATGNFEQAAAVYRQAWHVSRVNHGLFSEQQLDHLNLLIKALIELAQWNEVHDLHRLSFLIASRVYPPDDVRYLVAAEFYTSWQWRAINSRQVPDEHSGPFQTIQELSAIYSEVIDKVEHATNEHMQGLVNLVLGKARTDISIARALVNAGQPQHMLGPAGVVPETECFDRHIRNGASKRHCHTVSLALRNFDDDPAGFIPFALGRYLKQIDGSIARLERLGIEQDTKLSPDETQWINSLIATLRDEYQGLLITARRL